jgi:exodeoxyribonuclease III
MQIATWNVNSIKAHFDQVHAWILEAKPDVVCLQEIKCEEAAFPQLAFEEIGYRAVIQGQKTYNGVAILSKLPIEDIIRGLPGDEADAQARYIQGTVFDGNRGITVASIYLPNGNPPATEKYSYKLAWMERLSRHAGSLLSRESPVVLAGDYNVIPAAFDAKNPDAWLTDALYLPQTRYSFRAFENLGLTDAFRALHPSARQYSFYDYQAGAWQKKNGIRIDHLMLSPQAADTLASARIDDHVRGWEKPSDHVPVVIDL